MEDDVLAMCTNTGDGGSGSGCAGVPRARLGGLLSQLVRVLVSTPPLPIQIYCFLLSSQSHVFAWPEEAR